MSSKTAICKGKHSNRILDSGDNLDKGITMMYNGEAEPLSRGAMWFRKDAVKQPEKQHLKLGGHKS